MRVNEILSEAPLADFQPLGDFNKPGPFRGPDKRLVPHEVNKLKTAKFLENTPYDFRLFFSNIPGTGKYSETGPVNEDQLVKMFGPDIARQVIEGSQDAITVVFVGNSGADKKMMTPWIMAHRFGHAIQAGARNSKWSAWREAEQHFFTNVNQILSDYYNKHTRRGVGANQMHFDMVSEYNALFNALGTQRSSRTGQIKRPYEFLYEIFAQYLKDGKVTFNPLPHHIGYGHQAWGNHTKSLIAQANAEDIKWIADTLSYDMEILFGDVLSASVGTVYVM